MRKENIEINYFSCNFDELESNDKIVIEAAKKALFNAYAPFSGFKVGAALELENGEIFSSNNQENEVLPVGVCAERSLLNYTRANRPDLIIKTIAIAGLSCRSNKLVCTPPCGICRQTLRDIEKRQGKDIRILIYSEDKILIVENVKTLLPIEFSLSL